MVFGSLYSKRAAVYLARAVNRKSKLREAGQLVPFHATLDLQVRDRYYQDTAGEAEGI